MSTTLADAPLSVTNTDPPDEKLVATMDDALAQLRKSGFPTLVPLLPMMLQLRGEPYSLRDYYPFEVFYNTRAPSELVVKSGRQTSKTTNLAAQGLVASVTTPNFSTLFVTPLFEMIRRLSSDNVRPFIDQSPLKNYWISSKVTNNVLFRGFTNQSRMYFSFAYLDVERTRGIAADKVCYDEVQDMDSRFIPIIREVMSGSKYGGISQYTGTPKTLDNTLQQLWERSSRAEWLVKCEACNYENVPAKSHDLDEMIGPDHPDIGPERPAVVCAKCKRPVWPAKGFWVHENPGMKLQMCGIHVPQIILPLHYSSRKKWRALLAKRDGADGTPPYVFYNEVCGESFDIGAKLLTITDLQRAAVLHKNEIEAARRTISKYAFRALAIDWGGGGQTGDSWTVYAVMGIKADGHIDVIYGHRSPTPHDHIGEAQLARRLFSTFDCHIMAHDFAGSGHLRETFCLQNGIPADRVMPCFYTTFARGPLVRYKQGDRNYYQIDKPRSLVLLCQQIKDEKISFFEFDYYNSDDSYESRASRSLLGDLLAIGEELGTTSSGNSYYKVVTAAGKTDDFAQAVNLGACGLWHISGLWPDLRNVRYMERVPNIDAAMRDLDPEDPWNGGGDSPLYP